MALRLRRNKKGSDDLLLFWIWEILACVMVIIIVILSVRGIASGSTYWKKYYAVDIGLISDLANTNQGDFVINYALKPAQEVTQNQVQYEFTLTDSTVVVYTGPHDKSKAPYTWPYAKAKTITASPNLVITDFLVISKIGSLFQLGTYTPQGITSCPAFTSTMQLGPTTKFVSESLSADTKTIAESYTAAMREFGSGANAKTVLHVFWYHEPGANMTIYYPSGIHATAGEKLSCMLATGYGRITVNSQVQFNVFDPAQFDTKGYEAINKTLHAYRTALANDPIRQDELWIIVQLDDEALKIAPVEIARIFKNETINYYR